MLNAILLQVNVAADTLNAAVNVAKVATEENLTFLELYKMGGALIMAPLTLFSVVAVYIFVERYLAISKAAKEDANFMNHIKDFIHEGKIDAAKSLCKATNTPIARMIEKGLLRIGKPLADIGTAIENVGNIEVGKLERNVSLLSTIAGVGPMLGFLGTVIGMISAFYKMAKAGNNLDISLLSSGVYQAMITTVAGLIVGIIAYIAYNILVARTNAVVRKMEARTIEFMDLLQEPA